MFARFVLGTVTAGAMIMPSTLSILTNVFPAGERARAIAIWTAVSGGGAAIGGPTTGGGNFGATPGGVQDIGFARELVAPGDELAEDLRHRWRLLE